MTEPTPALWPTAHQAILAGQSPAIPGPTPSAEKEQARRYRCMCRSGISGRGTCGCVLTDPPSYIGTDGLRHFYDEPEPRVEQAWPPMATRPDPTGGDPS